MELRIRHNRYLGHQAMFLSMSQIEKLGLDFDNIYFFNLSEISHSNGTSISLIDISAFAYSILPSSSDE